MNKKLVVVLSLALVLAVVGMLFAQAGNKTSRGGGRSKITLYSNDGRVLQEWTIPGPVEAHGGVFTFVDSKSDHSIRITGTVVVDAAP